MLAKQRYPVENNPTAFPKLSDDQINLLSKFYTITSYKPGDKLFIAGEKDSNFYIIKRGRIAIVDHSADHDTILLVHEPGEFTGDIDMLGGRPALVSGIAQTACETYKIASSDLKRIINEMPQLSDILLTAFLMRRQLLEKFGTEGIRVVGSRYSPDTHRIREFLAKNKIISTWIDLENDSRTETLLKHFNISPDETPVVICRGGKILRNPSSANLATCLGIRQPHEHVTYDLVIVGAGPAGLAAAVYGASEGLNTLLVDKIGPGGQAGNSSLIENYMGFPTGLSGTDLANRALVQALKFGAELSAATEVTHLVNHNGYYQLNFDSGDRVSSKCVLIATGVAYRKLDAIRCEDFEGAGVYYEATYIESELCQGLEIVIVGDGNSAGQAAIFLSECASKVYLAILGDDLGAHMSRYLSNRIEQASNVEVLRHTKITKMEGEHRLKSVELTNLQSGKVRHLSCAAVFVFIGAMPHTSWLSDTLDLDPQGFVKTGLQISEPELWPLERQPFLLETSQPGIFAAGDVRLGSIKRVASAVGEGATAVLFVHQYLAHF